MSVPKLPASHGHNTAAEVFSALEEDIALGALQPRERLIEDDLCERFATKRHVIRQCLSELEGLGLVVRRRNRGAMVRDFSRPEVEEIYSIRELLEASAARRIPLPASKQWRVELEHIHGEHSKAVEEGDLATVFRHNLSFHRTFFSACGNSYLEQLISDFALKSHAIRSYTIADPHLLQRARDEHAGIIEAVGNNDREALVRRVVSHIQPAKEAYLARRAKLGLE